MPADMHVGVDSPGHERAVAEIDVHTRRVAIDPHNFGAFDHHRGLAQFVPPPVNDARSANDNLFRVEQK